MTNKIPKAARGKRFLVESPLRAISPAVLRIRYFLRDESSMPYESNILGSGSCVCRAVDREIGSWISTPEARYKTLRKAIILAATHAAIM